MLEDKARWNRKYRQFPMPTDTAAVVAKYAPEATVGRALDIACGTGRHTILMAELGFDVDAVDYSDYALEQLPKHPRIHPVEADLDQYIFLPMAYDLIINCNYLDRKMYGPIVEALKFEGMVIFETFLEAEGEAFHQPSNPDFLLQSQELMHVFSTLTLLHYEEREDRNLRGEKVRIATLVARKSR